MKVYNLPRGYGKTTKCMKRAIRLLKKGYSVLYLNPFNTKLAFEQMQIFINNYVKNTKRFNTDLKCNKFNTIRFNNKAEITFASFGEIYSQTQCGSIAEYYFHKVIFDDVDMLLRLKFDTISMTDHRR